LLLLTVRFFLLLSKAREAKAERHTLASTRCARAVASTKLLRDEATRKEKKKKMDFVRDARSCRSLSLLYCAIAPPAVRSAAQRRRQR
jgi:hypothetical protein